MCLSNSFSAKIICEDGKDSLKIKGYRTNRLKTIIGWLIVVASFGTLGIFLAWRKKLRMRLFYKESPLQHADKVLLKVCRLHLILNFWI